MGFAVGGTAAIAAMVIHHRGANALPDTVGEPLKQRWWVSVGAALLATASWIRWAPPTVDSMGWAQLPATLMVALVLGGATALSVIDACSLWLPNRAMWWVWGGLAMVLGLTAAAGETAAMLRALLCGVALGGFFWLLAFISPRSMGGGDAKFAIVVGALAGWFSISALLMTLVAMCLIGGLLAIVVLICTRDRRRQLPFAPVMWLAVLIGVIVSNQGAL